MKARLSSTISKELQEELTAFNDAHKKDGIKISAVVEDAIRKELETRKSKENKYYEC